MIRTLPALMRVKTSLGMRSRFAIIQAAASFRDRATVMVSCAIAPCAYAATGTTLMSAVRTILITVRKTEGRIDDFIAVSLGAILVELCSQKRCFALILGTRFGVLRQEKEGSYVFRVPSLKKRFAHSQCFCGIREIYVQ